MATATPAAIGGNTGRAGPTTASRSDEPSRRWSTSSTNGWPRVRTCTSTTTAPTRLPRSGSSWASTRAAMEKGIPATGYDLSPLAVLATRVKVSNYDVGRLKAAWTQLRGRLSQERLNGLSRTYPQLVVEALPGALLRTFDAIGREIDWLPS